MIDAVREAILKIEQYAINNKLSVNTNKTQVMLVSKDKQMKENFQINFKGKLVKHSAKVTILGNIFNDQLNWKDQFRTNVIPGLHYRARQIRNTSKYMNPQLRHQYASAVFKSKLLFGIESWGGVP